MIDCHIHLEKGPYTVEWLNQFVNTAISHNLDEIYLLEHSYRFVEFAPMYESICNYSNYQKKWFQQKSNSNLSIQNYIQFIETARQEHYPIKVKFGLEVCYFEEFELLMKDLVNSYPFDFVTGSVHWIDSFGFDHRKELWDGMNVDKIYKRYYEIMQCLITSDLFTGVAHPDSIKAFGHKPSFNMVNTYEKIADMLNQHNMYAEQSGGLHLNYGVHCELGMNETMRKIFLDKGVRFLTASDAHRPEDVGVYIEQLEAILNG